LALGVLVLYLVLPLVIESLIAWRLQTELVRLREPDVEVSSIEVSSSFPPMMLLGRIDRVQVTMAQPNEPNEPNASVDLEGVRVYAPSLIAGNPSIEAENCLTHNIDYKDVTDQIQCLQVGE
jgi:hypothetical protein